MNATPKRFKKWLGRILLAGLGMLLALGSVEATLWLAGYPLGLYPVGLFEQDAGIGYHRPVPGFVGRVQTGETRYEVRINEAGLRGPALRSRDGGALRILGLGDSFTFGIGVDDEQTYLRQLEHLLNERSIQSQKHIEVLNAGVPGFGTVHEWRYLEQIGLRHNPDLVLLAFYAANDLSDNRNPQSMQAVKGVLVPEGRVRFVDFKIWLRTHSRTYGFMADALKRQRSIGNWLAQVGLVREADPGMGVGFPGTLYYLKSQPPEVQSLWENTESLLLKLRDQLRKKKIPLVILSVPDRVSVYESWKARAASQAGLRVDDLDGFLPDRHLASFCRKHRIPLIELTDVLRQAAVNGTELYFQYDGHWTAEGHRVAAEQIAEFLTTHPQLGRLLR
ncbi:MAG: hypothetical protein HYY57_06430 [Candidatus Omnitrophica bacterium]|nr:hypothetical protein [Candidatus Omnitrophota bacterium]